MDSKFIRIELKGGKKPYAMLVVQPDREQDEYLLRPVYGPEGIYEAADDCLDSFPKCGGIRVLERVLYDDKYVGKHGF